MIGRRSFPIEETRIPRPWKVFESALLLLFHPREIWPAVKKRGNLPHMLSFWCVWTGIGVACIIATLLTWDRSLPRLDELLAIIAWMTFSLTMLQVLVYVALEGCCLLLWIPMSLSRALFYVVSFLPPVVALTVSIVRIATALGADPPHRITVLGIRMNFDAAFVGWGVTMPSALFLAVTLPPFLRWRCRMSARGAWLIGAGIPLYAVILICLLLAQPQV